MIYVSLLTLDAALPDTRRLLSDPYRVHQKLLNAWEDGEGGRVLFRIDEGRPPRILVHSPAPADWERAFPQGRLLAAEALQKEVELRFAVGQTLRFLLRANPTVRRPARDPETGEVDFARPGKRVGLLREEEQRNWLESQGEVRALADGPTVGGFRVIEVELRNRREVVSFRQRTRVTHQAVDFEGLLEVTDPAALVNTVANGVGPAKGFGFGLLSLGRPGR